MQNHHPALAPENTKIPKNTKMAQKLPCLYFGVFYRIAGDQPGVGDFFFSRNFSYFGIQWFLGSVPPRRIARLGLFVEVWAFNCQGFGVSLEIGPQLA